MSLTLRQSSVTGAVTAGTALTYAQMDANFSGLADGSLITSLDSSKVPFLQSGIGGVAENVQDVLRYQGKSIISFGASTSGTAAANSAAIQAAHDAAVNSVYQRVYFPAGTYNITTLNWSPYVQAVALGKVYLLTANASGRTIQVSDQYGQQLVSGTGYTRSVIWDGPFALVNTNVGNTATAWSFGGATSANACNLATPLRNVETWGFGGGVYEFRHNAFLLEFHSAFAKKNPGNHIIVPLGTVNSGESIKFIGGASGGVTGGTPGAGYLLDINTASSMSFDFVSHSADYLTGFNKTGNTNPLVKVNWTGGNIEWDQVARTYIQNDGGMDLTILSPNIASVGAAGWPVPSITDTSGTSTTRVLFARYQVHTGETPHRATGANARLFLDDTPNFQGASTPTTFVTYASGAVGQTYLPQRDPTTGWSVDFAQRGSNPITASGTLTLAVGSGVVIVHNDSTGNAAVFLCYAGVVVKLGGDASVVAGAAGASQIGLAYAAGPGAYQISNGYATTQNVNVGLLKSRTAS